MQGHIAQAPALVVLGNAALQGGRAAAPVDRARAAAAAAGGRLGAVEGHDHRGHGSVGRRRRAGSGNVQRGSYVVDCTDCGADVIATSWIAVGPHYQGPMRAVVIDDQGRPVGEPITGDARVVVARISEIAGRGLRLRLRPAE